MDEINDVSVDNDPLAGVIRSEQSASLAQLIQILPEKDRELLRLRYLADLSARLLHRSSNAVKKSLYRLLARLQSQLEVSNE